MPTLQPPMGVNKAPPKYDRGTRTPHCSLWDHRHGDSVQSTRNTIFFLNQGYCKVCKTENIWMTRHSSTNAGKEIERNVQVKRDQGILRGHNEMKQKYQQSPDQHMTGNLQQWNSGRDCKFLCLVPELVAEEPAAQTRLTH